MVAMEEPNDRSALGRRDGLTRGRSTCGMYDFACGLVVGSLLVYSGVMHLANPYQFLGSAYDYRLIGIGSGVVLAGFLPAFQLVCGAALVCRRFVNGAFVLSSIMIVGFIVAQSSVMLRGLDIDCACFGSAGGKVTIGTLARTAALFLLCTTGTIAHLYTNRSR